MLRRCLGIRASSRMGRALSSGFLISRRHPRTASAQAVRGSRVKLPKARNCVFDEFCAGSPAFDAPRRARPRMTLHLANEHNRRLQDKRVRRPTDASPAPPAGSAKQSRRRERQKGRGGVASLFANGLGMRTSAAPRMPTLRLGSGPYVRPLFLAELIEAQDLGAAFGRGFFFDRHHVRVLRARLTGARCGLGIRWGRLSRSDGRPRRLRG